MKCNKEWGIKPCGDRLAIGLLIFAGIFLPIYCHLSHSEPSTQRRINAALQADISHLFAAAIKEFYIFSCLLSFLPIDEQTMMNESKLGLETAQVNYILNIIFECKYIWLSYTVIVSKHSD